MRTLRCALSAGLMLAGLSCATPGTTGPSASGVASAPVMQTPPAPVVDGSTSGSKVTAPDFVLPTVNGGTFRLSSLLGQKTILLNFWATWCGPCCQELPHLQSIYSKYKDQGFEVVSVAMDDPSSVARVAPFVRQNGLKFTVLLDTESRATSLYNPASSAPFNALISRDGQVVWSRAGYEAGDDAIIEQKIAALVQPVSAASPAAIP